MLESSNKTQARTLRLDALIKPSHDSTHIALRGRIHARVSEKEGNDGSVAILCRPVQRGAAILQGAGGGAGAVAGDASMTHRYSESREAIMFNNAAVWCSQCPWRLGLRRQRGALGTRRRSLSGQPRRAP